mgnify:CR=1 FL=1
MKIKKIIKGIIGVGVVGGVAYLAYKVGECNGEINERYREKSDDFEPDEDDEDYNFYDDLNYDEPDDGCIAPADSSVDKYSIADLEDISSFEERTSDHKRNFVPLSAIQTIPENTAKSLLLNSVTKGFITNKLIRDSLGAGYEAADEILSEFQNAGYISSEQGGNYRYPALITFSDLVELLRESRDR